MLFSQWQSSHRQTPSGTTALNSTATIVTQATHCRNKLGLIVSFTFILPIISSRRRQSNNILGGKPKISDFRRFRVTNSPFPWYNENVEGVWSGLAQSMSPHPKPFLWEKRDST